MAIRRVNRERLKPVIEKPLSVLCGDVPHPRTRHHSGVTPLDLSYYTQRSREALLSQQAWGDEELVRMLLFLVGA